MLGLTNTCMTSKDQRCADRRLSQDEVRPLGYAAKRLLHPVGEQPRLIPRSRHRLEAWPFLLRILGFLDDGNYREGMLLVFHVRPKSER